MTAPGGRVGDGTADDAGGSTPGADAALRVVVLDDDERYRSLMVQGLAGDEGIEVVGDARLDDAAPPLLARTTPDVLLLDLAGGLHGITMLEPLREAAPGAHVIALVGFDADDVQGVLAQAGVVGQISKRTRPTALGAEIRAMVAMVMAVERALQADASVGTALELDPTSGRRARQFVDSALHQWGCEDLVDTVTLLTSELVANALMHAESAAEITVRLHPGCVRIEVHDNDPTIPRRRQADPDSPSGRGLALVEMLSRSWGVEPTVTGKYIWFEVDRPDQVPVDGEAGDRADR